MERFGGRLGLVGFVLLLIGAAGRVRGAEAPLDTGAIQSMRLPEERSWLTHAERLAREAKLQAEAKARQIGGLGRRDKKKRRSRKQKYDQALQASEYETGMRRSPITGQVPTERVLEAARHAARMPGGREGPRAPVLVRPLAEPPRGKDGRSLGLVAYSQTLAPAAGGGVNNGWTSLGPGNIGGRTRGLIVQSSQILYAAGVAGGVWKSTNGGTSWVFLDDFMSNLAVSCLLQDPNDPNTIYAGTGEGFQNFDSVRGAGIFKSIDAGVRWNRLGGTTGTDFQFVTRMAFSPIVSQKLYASTRTGLFVSTNGGNNWSSLLAGVIFDVVAVRDIVNNVAVEKVYCWKSNDGLYESVAGAAFTRIGGTDYEADHRGALAISRNLSTYYLATAPNDGPLSGFRVSTNKGQSWTTGETPSGFGNQGWYNLVITVDPLNSARVWIGGLDLFRSDDSGDSWTTISNFALRRGDAKFVHADQHAIVFDPGYNGTTNQNIFFGNDGGVFKTTNGAAADASVAFTSLNNNYGVTQFYHGASSRTGTVYIGGTQDNGTLKFNPSSPTKDWSEIKGGDGGYAAVDQTNPNVIYAESQNFSFAKATDGGILGNNSFFDATNGITELEANFLFIAPFAMDPSNSNRLWIGGKTPWRTVDGAANWTNANGGLELTQFKITAWGIAPSDGNTVYLGTQGGELFRSSNALGASPTWANVSNSFVPFGTVSWLWVDRTNPNIAYATYSNYDLSSNIWKTTNGGTSWSSIKGASIQLPTVPCHTVVTHPTNPSRIYVGTDTGCFASEDGGVSWINISSPGLANTVVEALVFQGNSKLFAFTHGRGLFAADLDQVSAIDIQSIAAATGQISRGQSFPTTVTVRNGATGTINFTAARLVISNGAIAAPQLNVVRSLAPGATTTFTFNVSGVSLGSAQITSATFTATFASTGLPAPVGSNNSFPASVDVVVGSPSLSLRAIAAQSTLVGVGQTFRTTVTVRNDGSGAASITAGQLMVSNGLLNPSPFAGAVTVPPAGGTAQITFNVTGVSLGSCNITSAAFTATNTENGAPVGLVANVASPVAVTITNAFPSLRIAALSVSATRVNTGQTLTASATIRNDGTGPATLTQQWLVLSNGTLAASPLALSTNLGPGGATVRYDFPLTAVSAGSCVISSFTCTATNPSNGLPLPILANLGIARTVTIQTPAALRVDSVTPGRTTVSRGQPAVTFAIRVTHPGGATTGASLAGLSVTPRIGSSLLGYSLNLPAVVPNTLAAGQSLTYDYTVDVLPSAPLGATALAATVRAQDANTGLPIAVTNTPTASWTVRSPAALQVTAIAASAATVLHGQSGLTAEISVTNTTLATSGTSATTLGGGPRFSGSTTGYTIVPLPGNATTLAAGQSTKLTYTVAVLGGAPRGPIPIAAGLTALDANGSTPVPITQTAQTSWTVRAPGSVTAASIQLPSATVSQGQTGSKFQIALSNPADADVTLTAQGLRFNGSTAGFTIATAPGNATLLPAGQSRVLTFTVDVQGATAPGTYTVSSDIRGTDAATSQAAVVSVPVSPTWKVQTPPALTVGPIRLSHAQVLRGQRNLKVEATVVNTASATNGATAGTVAAGLTFNNSASGYTVTTATGNVASVAAGATRVLTFAVDAQAGAPFGATTVRAVVTARDANSGAVVPIANTATASWDVPAPAALRLDSIRLSRTTVTLGQGGLTAELVLTNTGQTSATAVAAQLRFNGSPAGVLVAPAPGNAATLAAGATRTLTFVLDVLASAPLGPTAITANVTALESLLGATVAVTGTPSASWTVQAPAALAVTVVRLSRPRILQGQRGLTAEVVVTNGGQAVLSGLRAGLIFAGSTSGFTVTTAAGNASTLSSGETRTLTFTVDVAATAAPGDVTVAASVAATETGSGKPAPVVNTVSALWRVLTPASLQAVVLRLPRTRVSRSQRGLAVEASVLNSGQTTATAIAASLRFNGSTGGFAVTPAAGNTADLAPGATRVLTFTVDVEATAPLVDTALTLVLAAQEALAGGAAVVANALQSSWRVQTPPSLVVQSIAIGRSVLPAGEFADATVVLANEGQATARIGTIRLVSQATAVVPTALLTPAADVAGAGSLSLTFRLEGLASGSSRLTTVLLDATDTNTGGALPLAANRATPGPALAVGRRPLTRLAPLTSAFSVDGRPATFTLDASTSSDPDGDPVSYAWSQVTGPSVTLTPGSTAVQRLTARTVARYGFRVVVSDPLGLSTTETAFLSAIANSSPAVTIRPVPAAITGSTIPLSGSAIDAENDVLTYRWRQESGPVPLTLAGGSPNSPALEIRNAPAGRFVLRLTADDSKNGIGSTTASVDVLPLATATLALGIGPNLVSLPIAPVTGDGHAYDSADLARDSGGAVVAKLVPSPLGMTRFVPYLPGASRPFTIEPGAAYLIHSTRARSVSFTGRPWPEFSTTQLLLPFLTGLGFPRGVPAGETAQTMVTRTGAKFLLRTSVDPLGRSRLDLFIPGISQPFPLRPGEGYLFAVDRKTTLLLPSGP